jgi:peptide/nickel transport system substrate-binding protein
MTRTTFPLLAISSVALLMGMAQARTRPRYGDTLRVDTQTVAMSGDYTPEVLVGPVFETLVTVDGNGHLQPGLASSWTSSSDERRWEFTLRPGVRFHDDELCDSPAMASSLAQIPGFPWQVHATARGLVIESDTPQPDLPALLSLPRYAIFAMTTDGHAVGTGPFSIENRTGSSFSLKANDDYWGGRPFVDSIQLLTSRSMRDQASDLSFDRADVVELAPEQLRRAQQDRLRLDVSRPSETIFLVFDSAKPQLNDVRLRQAISLAIDRAAIRNVIFQHQGEIASGLLPNWLSGYEFLFPADQDVAKARQLRALVGQIPTITIGYDDGDPIGRLIAERIALNAHDTGLNMQAVAGTGDLRLRHIGLPSLNPEAALSGVIDRLNLAAAGPMSDTESLYNAERAALQTYSAIPLVHLPRVVTMKDRVRDWSATPDGHWHLDQVWIAPRNARVEGRP